MASWSAVSDPVFLHTKQKCIGTFEDEGKKEKMRKNELIILFCQSRKTRYQQKQRPVTLFLKQADSFSSSGYIIMSIALRSTIDSSSPAVGFSSACDNPGN